MISKGILLYITVERVVFNKLVKRYITGLDEIKIIQNLFHYRSILQSESESRHSFDQNLFEPVTCFFLSCLVFYLSHYHDFLERNRSFEDHCLPVPGIVSVMFESELLSTEHGAKTILYLEKVLKDLSSKSWRPHHYYQRVQYGINEGNQTGYVVPKVSITS